MNRTLTLLCATVFLVVSALSQTDNPHARHMERAHPTPLRNVNYDGLTYMVPMLTEKVYPSLFLNVNMIVEETDPLPHRTNRPSPSTHATHVSSLVRL
ncbi:MAG: hypothetical protein IPM83_02340 [Ignavibacteria bacterium]|nr:hypothetical protein [Ignavibacteria bacterium]